jgi:hypothetical protein
MDSSFFNSSLPHQQKITVENNIPKNFDNNTSSELNHQNYSQTNMQGNNSINAVHHNAANSQVKIQTIPQNAAQTSPNQAPQNVQLTPQAIAQEVSTLPGNANCADCKTILDKSDKWAVLHFGIYVCEDCKLNHEQMITHMNEFSLPVSEIISELEPENFPNGQNSTQLMQQFHQKCREHDYHNQIISQPKILQMTFTETEISEGNTVSEPSANWSMFDYFLITRFGGNDRVNAYFEKDIPSWYYKLSLTDPTEFKLNWLLMKYLSKFKTQLEGKLFIPDVKQDVNQIITHFNKTQNNPGNYITPPNIKFQLIKVSVGQGFEKSYKQVQFGLRGDKIVLSDGKEEFVINIKQIESILLNYKRMLSSEAIQVTYRVIQKVDSENENPEKEKSELYEEDCIENCYLKYEINQPNVDKHRPSTHVMSMWINLILYTKLNLLKKDLAEKLPNDSIQENSDEFVSKVLNSYTIKEGYVSVIGRTINEKPGASKLIYICLSETRIAWYGNHLKYDPNMYKEIIPGQFYPAKFRSSSKTAEEYLTLLGESMEVDFEMTSSYEDWLNCVRIVLNLPRYENVPEMLIFNNLSNNVMDSNDSSIGSVNAIVQSGSNIVPVNSKSYSQTLVTNNGNTATNGGSYSSALKNDNEKVEDSPASSISGTSLFGSKSPNTIQKQNSGQPGNHRNNGNSNDGIQNTQNGKITQNTPITQNTQNAQNNPQRRGSSGGKESDDEVCYPSIGPMGEIGKMVRGEISPEERNNAKNNAANQGLIDNDRMQNARMMQNDRMQHERMQNDRMQNGRMQNGQERNGPNDRNPLDRMQNDRMQNDRMQNDRMHDRNHENRSQFDRNPNDRMQNGHDRNGPYDRTPHDRMDRQQFDRNGRDMDRNSNDRPPQDRNMHDMRDRPMHDRPVHDRPHDRSQNPGTYRQPYNSQNTPYGSGGFNNRTGNRDGGNNRQGLLSQIPNERYIPENARYPENSGRGGFSNRGSGPSGPHGNASHFNGPNGQNGPTGPSSGHNSWSNSGQNSGHNSGPNQFNNSNNGPNQGPSPAQIYNKTENPMVQQVAKQRIDNHAALRRQGSGTPENLDNKHKQISGGQRSGGPAVGPNGVPDSECYPAIAPHLADKNGEGPNIGFTQGAMNRREGLLQQPNNELVKGIGSMGLGNGMQNGPGNNRNSPNYGQNKNFGGNNSNGYGSPQNTPSNGPRVNGGYNPRANLQQSPVNSTNLANSQGFKSQVEQKWNEIKPKVIEMIYKFKSLNPTLPNTLPSEANFNNMDHANYCMTIVGEFIYKSQYLDGLLKLAEIKNFFIQTQNPDIGCMFQVNDDVQLCQHSLLKFAYKWAQNRQNAGSPQGSQGSGGAGDRGVQGGVRSGSNNGNFGGNGQNREPPRGTFNSMNGARAINQSPVQNSSGNGRGYGQNGPQHGFQNGPQNGFQNESQIGFQNGPQNGRYVVPRSTDFQNTPQINGYMSQNNSQNAQLNTQNNRDLATKTNSTLNPNTPEFNPTRKSNGYRPTAGSGSSGVSGLGTPTTPNGASIFEEFRATRNPHNSGHSNASDTYNPKIAQNFENLFTGGPKGSGSGSFSQTWGNSNDDSSKTPGANYGWGSNEAQKESTASKSIFSTTSLWDL